VQKNDTLLKPVEKKSKLGKSKKTRKPKKKRYLFLKFLILVLICVVVFMACSLYGYRYIAEGTAQAQMPLTEQTGVVFKVSSGSSAVNIAEQLKEQGFIDNTQLFKLLSKFMGFDSAYKAGNFIISHDMNYYALMVVLSGEPLKNPTKDIMIPEGKKR
jgi:cell division protein YceG involved in septum cleavage